MDFAWGMTDFLSLIRHKGRIQTSGGLGALKPLKGRPQNGRLGLMDGNSYLYHATRCVLDVA